MNQVEKALLECQELINRKDSTTFGMKRFYGITV